MPSTKQAAQIEVCDSCGKWRVITSHARNLPWLPHHHLLKAFRKFDSSQTMRTFCPDCDEQRRVTLKAGSVH